MSIRLPTAEQPRRQPRLSCGSVTSETRLDPEEPTPQASVPKMGDLDALALELDEIDHTLAGLEGKQLPHS